MGLLLTDFIRTLLFGTLVNFNVFFLLLLPSGVGTADHLPSSHPPLASSSLHLSYTVRCFGCWSSLI